MLCLVVEYLADGDLLPRFTREHAGARVDLMVEPDDESRKQRSELALVRGTTLEDVDALVAQLKETRSPVQTLRRDAVAGLWFGRLHFDTSRLASPSAKALASLGTLIGPPWIHVEHGVVLLRARLRDPVHADDAVELAQQALAAAGFDAQCVVQEVSPRDHSVWEDLVQHGIGLTL